MMCQASQKQQWRWGAARANPSGGVPRAGCWQGSHIMAQWWNSRREMDSDKICTTGVSCSFITNRGATPPWLVQGICWWTEAGPTAPEQAVQQVAATKQADDHLQFRKAWGEFRKPLEGPRMSGSKPRLRKWNGSSLAGRRSGRASGASNEDWGACYLQWVWPLTMRMEALVHHPQNSNSDGRDISPVCWTGRASLTLKSWKR